MRIVGLYNWHDGGYCVLNDGTVEEHIEFERYTIKKESPGDSSRSLKSLQEAFESVTKLFYRRTPHEYT